MYMKKIQYGKNRWFQINLNRILTDKTLSKPAYKKLKKEIISIYKKYLLEYKKLPNLKNTK